MAKLKALSKKMYKEPYMVEAEGSGCSKCGAGRNWTIVGPSGIAYHTAFDNKQAAQDIADDFNIVYEKGRRSMVNI